MGKKKFSPKVIEILRASTPVSLEADTLVDGHKPTGDTLVTIVARIPTATYEKIKNGVKTPANPYGPLTVNGVTYWYCKGCNKDVVKGERCRYCGRSSRENRGR